MPGKPKKSAIVNAKTEPIKAPYNEPLTCNFQIFLKIDQWIMKNIENHMMLIYQLTTSPISTELKSYHVVPLNVGDCI